MKLIGLKDPIFNNTFYVKSKLKHTIDEYVIFKDDEGFEFLAEVTIIEQTSDVINNQYKGFEVVRIATSEDIKANLVNAEQLDFVRDIFSKSAASSDLTVNFYSCEYSLDMKKLKIYFYHNQMIDFRNLIFKLLAAHKKKVKLQLVQVKGREYASLLGGIGICGLELCCHNFNYYRPYYPKGYFNFRGYPIHFKFGSDGVCGAGKCCVLFEIEEYLETLKRLPDYNSQVVIDECEYKTHNIDFYNEKLILVNKNNEELEIGFDEVGDYFEN